MIIEVNADHLTLHVEERSAGIAVIDRGVCLDKVIKRRILNIAIECADNAGGNRDPMPKGLPAAKTCSPTRSRLLSPQCATCKG